MRGAQVFLRTDAPTWLFPEGVEPLESPGWPIDIGVAQHDGLELDVDETHRRWAEHDARFDAHAGHESRVLRAARVDLVLGDVPPLAFAAAAAAGLPSAAIANFGWDWIYAPWGERFAPVIRRIRAAYAQADVLFRLPLHAEGADAFPAFRRVQDVPLITRRPARERDAVRRELGLDDGRRVVLLSFGGYDASNLELHGLAPSAERYLYVLTPVSGAQSEPRDLPENVRVLPSRQLDYLSLTAASDVVVTKPGYGVVVDTLVARVPVLYTDRGPFREYPILARALETFGRARYVPSDEVRRCNLAPHLDLLLNDPAPRAWADLRGDGADVIAEHVLAHVAGTRRQVAASS